MVQPPAVVGCEAVMAYNSYGLCTHGLYILAEFDGPAARRRGLQSSYGLQ